MQKSMILLAAALVLSACGPQPTQQMAQQQTYRPNVQPAYQGEDCDFDDMLERDEDCGFRKRRKHYGGHYGSRPTHTVVHHYVPRPTTKTVYRPAYRPSPAAYRPSTSSFKPSRTTFSARSISPSRRSSSRR